MLGCVNGTPDMTRHHGIDCDACRQKGKTGDLLSGAKVSGIIWAGTLASGTIWAGTLASGTRPWLRKVKMLEGSVEIAQAGKCGETLGHHCSTGKCKMCESTEETGMSRLDILLSLLKRHDNLTFITFTCPCVNETHAVVLTLSCRFKRRCSLENHEHYNRSK